MHFEFGDLTPFNHFIFCSLILKWIWITEPTPLNISVQFEGQEISSDSVANVGVTTVYTTVWELNRSRPLRVFERRPVRISSLQANVTVGFPAAMDLGGTYLWSIGHPGLAIVQSFLRVVFFVLSAVLLVGLVRNYSLTDAWAWQLAFLLGGVVIASDPLYIAVFFTSAQYLGNVDSKVHLVFVTIGMYFLPFLNMRQTNSRASFFDQVVANGLWFVLTLCAVGRLVGRLVGVGSRLLLLVLLGIYILGLVPLARAYKVDVSGEKIVAVALTVVFPISQFIGEVGQLVDGNLAGNSQIFELTVAVEHVALFALYYWPGKRGTALSDREVDPGDELNENDEGEAMLTNSIVRI
jgi:hypothetical protein